MLAVGLVFGFSLNTGAVAVVNQEVLEIFYCNDNKELEDKFATAACVGMVNKYFKELQPRFKSNLEVSDLCKHFSNYYAVLRASVAKNDEFTDVEQRDAIITEVTKVITADVQFKEQLNKLINGKTKHISITGRSVRGRFRCHPDGYTSSDW